MGIIVLTSGGQDSTTCLLWAIDRFGKTNIYPVAFDYGQRHAVELACAQEVCQELGVKMPMVIPVNSLEYLGGAALTDRNVAVNVDAKDTGNVYAAQHGLPSTFVPGRNMLFLTLACAYGAPKGLYDLVTGVCEADSSGYPDCRETFVQKAQLALSAALDEDIQIHAPLLHLNKAKTWELANDLGAFDLIVKSTHTCYNGIHDEAHLHPWGYGCGTCGACYEREKGFKEFMGNVGV